MSRLRILTGAVLALAAGLLSFESEAVTPRETTSAEAPGSDRRVMLMLDLGAEHYRAGGDYGGPYGDAMGEQARLRFARKIAREHNLTLLESWPMQLVGVDCIILQVEDDRSLEQVSAELSALPGVAWSQPLNEFTTQAASPTASAYNDRLFAAQPVASRWRLASLHRYATGKGVKIAIVDSRIDTSHPDLAGQIKASPDFSDLRRDSAERHGTGVAGIIAAKANNSMGIAGVAPDAKVLGLRACWERPLGGATVCNSLSLAKALTYALENRVDVINLSLTGPSDRLLQTLVKLAVKQGITVVAAIDEARPAASFPAFVPGVIPVADERLSAGGYAVYIAPGRDVPTTEPEGKWNIVSGSSFAAAHVSGLAALLRQLAGPGAARTINSSSLGPSGTIDACAAVARLSRLDSAACRKAK